jgi:hypothetical protein
VSYFNYDELPLMSKEIMLHFSDKLYLRRQDESGKFTKLRELFEIAQDHMVSVDLKVDSEVLRAKVS